MIDYDKIKDVIERGHAVSALDKSYKQGVGKLTRIEEEGLNQYAAGQHGYINHLMRNPDQWGQYGDADVDALEWTNAMVDIARRGSLPQTTRLYRGLQWDEHGYSPFKNGFEEGAEFTERAFISTSITREQAEEFASSEDRQWIAGSQPQFAVLHMIAPEGMPSINMNALATSNEVHEEEIVLAPSTWRIDKIVERDGIQHALVRCVSINLPEPFELKTEPVIQPGGFKRHPLAPTFYYGRERAPDHGLENEYTRPAGEKTDDLAWIPEQVRAVKMSHEFIVDGEEVERGEINDYLVQDPQTGKCWAVDEYNFEQRYSAQIEYGHSL